MPYPAPVDPEAYRRRFPMPPPVGGPPEVTAEAPETEAAPPPAVPPPSVMTGPNGIGAIGAPPPPVIAPPVQAPPPVATPEQDAYKQMVQAGPRTSRLGMIAGALVRGGAAYANSANPSRPIAHVNDQNLQDWAQRSPAGPGSYREGIARQGELAKIEQGDQARTQASAKSAMDLEHIKAQIQQAKDVGDWHRAEALNAQLRTEIARATEEDRKKNTQWSRIEQAGGTKREVRTYPKQSPPPAGDWANFPDPWNADMMIAVRAHPGEEIDEELARRLNIPKNADGKYYLNPGGAVRMGVSDNSAASAAEKRIADEAERKLRHGETNARIEESRANTELARRRTAQAEEDRQQAGRDRAQRDIEALQKEEQTLHAQREQYGQLLSSMKEGATMIDPRTGGQVQVTAQNAGAIRMAYQQKYDAATAQAQRSHEAQRKLIERHGGDSGPAWPPPAKQAGGGAPPPVKTSPSGGGRGAPAAPPEVQSGKPGRYEYPNGDVWMKAADGSITNTKKK